MSCTLYTLYSDIPRLHGKTSWRVHGQSATCSSYTVLQRPVPPSIMYHITSHFLSFEAAWTSTRERWPASKSAQDSQNHWHMFQLVLCLCNLGPCMAVNVSLALHILYCLIPCDSAQAIWKYTYWALSRVLALGGKQWYASSYCI